MIRITKKEMDYLIEQGRVFGKDIHKTHTRYPHYYITESDKNKEKLFEYRNSLVVN